MQAQSISQKGFVVVHQDYTMLHGVKNVLLGCSWALPFFCLESLGDATSLFFVNFYVSGPVTFCTVILQAHLELKEKQDMAGLECKHIRNKLGLLFK